MLSMSIFTLLIRRNVSEKPHRQHLFTHRTVHLEHKRDRQALRMLIVQIVVFVIITTPWMVYSITNVIGSFLPQKSGDLLVIEVFINAVAGALAFLFPAVSFYVYTSTSSLFRDELLIIGRTLIYRANKHRIQPQTSNELPRTQ